MKKIIIITFAAMLLVPSLQAQDTIHTRTLKEGYLFNAWLPDSVSYASLARLTFSSSSLVLFYGKYFYVPEEVDVYGIAAGLVSLYPEEVMRPYYILDTSWDNAFEYFSIYKAETPPLTRISDSLMIHLRDTPIAYYMNLGITDGWDTLVIPVYERYFDSACRVSDSFYVSFTHRSWNTHVYDKETGHTYKYGSWPVSMSIIHSSPFPPVCDRMIAHIDSFSFAGIFQPDVWMYEDTNRVDKYLVFLYPILTPPDTSGHGNEAVGEVNMLERMVAVQPNPATEQVKVVASCGMERVMAYNAAGVKVHEQAATGLSTTLNVAGWPTGTYILHIQTPLGVSTKRLVVAR